MKVNSEIKKLPFFLIIGFLWITGLGSISASAQQTNYKGWKAGVASVVITPDRPLWMAGYDDMERLSKGKIMDIWAKALALQDADGKQAVLITADLVGIPRKFSNHVRDRLKSKFNLSRDQIAINTSHAHTGPVLSDALISIYPVNESQQKDIDRYTDQLGNKLVALVGKALQSMQPVNLYSGNGVTRFQVNRRNNVESTLFSQTHLNGPNDYAVPVIKVTNGKGQLVAVAFGYACHNTVLADPKWSGDYAGFAQAELEKRHPETTAFFMQGCGAGTATYTVENGEIVGATVPKNPNGILCTKDTFANFILEMEVKVDTALNSGIQIRSHANDVNGNKEVYGYQIEVDPSIRAWSGGIYDSRRRGWLVDLKDKPEAQKAFKNEEWNHYRISANGDTIKTWLNNAPVATLIDTLDFNGFIGLQVHQSNSGQSLKVRFRDIKIKVLK